MINIFDQDNFSASAGTQLESHTPNTGGSWSKVTGSTAEASITSASRVRPDSATTLTFYSCNGTPTSANYIVQTTATYLGGATTGGGTGPIGRIQSGSQTFYWARLAADTSTTGHYDLYRCNSGTFTSLASTSTGGISISSGFNVIMQLVMNGSTISLNVSTDGGVTFPQVLTATDSSISSAGTAGVGMYDCTGSPTDTNGIQLSNFYGGIASIFDNFSGTSGTSVTSHTVNAGGPLSAVTGFSGTAVVDGGNRAYASSTSLGMFSYATVMNSANYSVYCDVDLLQLATSGQGIAYGPLARIQSGAGTFYWARFNTNYSPSQFGIDLFKCVSGSFTSLGTDYGLAITAGQTVRMNLTVNGTAITVSYSTNGGSSWTTAITATDSAISGAGSPGIGFNDSSTSGGNLRLKNVSTTPNLTILPSNSNWASSPANWYAISNGMMSADIGAYRTITFTNTTSATLEFDTSVLVSNGIPSTSYPQIRYSIYNGTNWLPYTDVNVGGYINVLSGGSTGTTYQLWYGYVRGDDSQDCWNTPILSVREMGLLLDSTGTVSTTTIPSNTTFWSGDSKTKGSNAGQLPLTSSALSSADAFTTYPHLIAAGMNTFGGFAGKGGVGWLWAGSGNVPQFTSSWKYAWRGQARNFTGLSLFVVCGMGPNDVLNNISDSSVQSAVQSWLADAISTLPSSCNIQFIIDVAGAKRSAVNAGIAAYVAANPSNAGRILPTTDCGTTFQTYFGTQFGSGTFYTLDSIHPSVWGHAMAAGILAPQFIIEPSASKVLYGTVIGPTNATTTGTLSGLRSSAF